MNLDSGDIVHTMDDVGDGVGTHILVGAGMVTGVGVVTAMEGVLLIMVTIGNALRKCRVSRQETELKRLKNNLKVNLHGFS
jgi:hypothetical protein